MTVDTIKKTAPQRPYTQFASPETNGASALQPHQQSIISNCCAGGWQQIDIQDLDCEKLLEIMDYWWKNQGF